MTATLTRPAPAINTATRMLTARLDDRFTIARLHYQRPNGSHGILDVFGYTTLTLEARAAELLLASEGLVVATDWVRDETGSTCGLLIHPDQCETCIHGCGHSLRDEHCGHRLCHSAQGDPADWCAGARLRLEGATVPSPSF